MDQYRYLSDSELLRLLLGKVESIQAALIVVLNKEHHIMKTQAELQAALDALAVQVQNESSVVAGVGTMIAGLEQQLTDALAGAGVPDATLAQVNAIFATAKDNADKLATDLLTGTPVPAPAPTA